MEFVSGYRDEFLDFAALLSGWFRKFVAERGPLGASLEGRWQQLEAHIRRLPQDPALWVLHVLPNRSVGISLGQGPETGPGPGLGAALLLGDEPPLHLQDLSPYVSFVSLEEGEEEEEEEEEKNKERGRSMEKTEEEDGQPAPDSREFSQEANPPEEPEEAEQDAGRGANGCLEDRAEDKTGPERRKGQRSEVTSETFNKEAFLASRGLTRGYWTQLSMLIPGPGAPRHPWGSTTSLSLLLNGDPYQLLHGNGPPLMPPVPPDPPRGLFGSWQDYYTWRGLSLDSPVAVLLTYPLTVYYIITHLVPQSFPELNIQNKKSLKIHVVEARKEFDLVMVFWELLVLLPHMALELQFVGDGLPPESDQQCFTLQRDGPEVSLRPCCEVSARLSSGNKEKGGRRDLQIKVSVRSYHLLQGPKPDLVVGKSLGRNVRKVEGGHGNQLLPALPPFVGFNPGFGLKDTWLSSLPRLQVRKGTSLTSCPVLPFPKVSAPSNAPMRRHVHGSSCSSLSTSPIQVGLDPQFPTQPVTPFVREVTWWEPLRVSKGPAPPQSLRVPAFFTESSEYSCVMDDQTMTVATGGGTSPPQPNPFRSPFRLRAADNCMPWYCNAFIFHLVYKPPPASAARPAPGPAPRAPTPPAPLARTWRRRGEKKLGRAARRRK
nr:zinc finger MYND domain-containing protein 15 isoform X10 [Manis javanica]